VSSAVRQALHRFFLLNSCNSLRYADVARGADEREKQGGTVPYYTQDQDWPRNPTHYFWRSLIEKVIPANELLLLRCCCCCCCR
jgi:hypothetical protein